MPLVILVHNVNVVPMQEGLPVPKVGVPVLGSNPSPLLVERSYCQLRVVKAGLDSDCSQP